MMAADFCSHTFIEAASLWLESRKRLAPGTVRDYKACIKSLTKFFGELRLKEIHIGHIAAYQEERKHTPIYSNREIGVVLAQVLDRAGLWEDKKKFYEPWPIPKSKRGIALEPHEEQDLFKIAASNPRWIVTYLYSVLARNTCMGTAENRQLRLMDVDRKDFDYVTVMDRVKNEYRPRRLECNEDARWALRNLLEIAYERGANLPEHYLIPHRARNGEKGWDPTRPIFSFYKTWRKIVEKLAQKHPHLKNLRFYDLRHTANTNLMENPSIPYNVIEHYMGHKIGSETKRIYDHLRNSNIKKAAHVLQSGHAEEKVEIMFKPPQSTGPMLVYSKGKKIN